MKQHQKLVRDKILEIIANDKVEFKSRVLSSEEYKSELLRKLAEEANEVVNTNGNPKELVKELADVWEVIEYIIKEFGLDHNEIQQVKQERHNSRGGFDNKIYLETTDED